MMKSISQNWNCTVEFQSTGYPACHFTTYSTCIDFVLKPDLRNECLASSLLRHIMVNDLCPVFHIDR